MTPADRQPQHCDHECVCAVLAVDGTEGDTSPCDFSGCLHDTRHNTSPPAPECDCLSCRINPDRPRYTIEQIADIDKQIRKAAKAEREKMLKLIETSRDALQEKHVDGNYDIRTHAKIEILSWLYHQVESLRAQQERPKERQIFEAYPKMTPADRQLYNQLCKLQGTLWKLIGQIESIKINLAGYTPCE